MSKQNYEKFQTTTANKLYLFERALKRTKTFERFCRKKFNCTPSELDDQYSETIKVDRSGETSFSLVLYHFYQSPEYARIESVLQRQIKFFPNRAVYDFPYTQYVYQPNFEENKWRDFKINLQCSKDHILRELEHFLDDNRKLKSQKVRSYGVLVPKKTDEIMRAYDLVEKHGNVVHAVWEMYPNTNGKQPSYDEEVNRRYQNVAAWHKKVNDLIGDL